PKEAFLHGQYSAALKPIDRMRSALDIDEAAKPQEDAVFREELNTWRSRVQDAYLSLIKGDPTGPAKVESIWREDQYLINLLQLDSEIPLSSFKKRMLSTILFNACRESMGREVQYFLAASQHERAAGLQANQNVLAATGANVEIVKGKA